MLGHRIEIEAMRKNGGHFLVELAITAYRVNGHAFFTAYLRDITERVRAERQRTAQYRIASLLTSASSIADAGVKIIETIAQSGDWVCGAIWVAEHATAREALATWQVDDGAELRSFIQTTRQISLRAGEGLPGRVAATGRLVQIVDVAEEENLPRREIAMAAGLRGAFAFPLFANECVNGVLELFSRNRAESDARALEMVGALGGQIGLFIHREMIQLELKQEKEAAEKANAAKDEFLAALSHELRTPLTPVLIWSGGLARDLSVPEELREGLAMVSRNIELEARLIDDLLDLTRITRGKLLLQLQTADAHALLQHVIEIVRNDIEGRKQKLVVELAARRFLIQADMPRVQQVFWNVIRNAAKYSPEGSAIEIRTSNSSDKTFCLEVRDHGAGIAPENLSRIFEAFEQINTKHGGLGLGLAISKTLVQMHGGKIVGSSDGLGYGSTFRIELPVAD